MSRSNNALAFGFRMVGNCRSDRRLIDWLSAFLAYCDCDDRAKIESESYLSAFCFGDEMAELLNSTGSPKGYAGETWTPWLWFDIDRDELDNATTDARMLAATLIERYELASDELLIFFSGSKGFHIGLPSALWQPKPATDFHSCCRRFAEAVEAVAGVAIDCGVYDRVRAFRAPNSRHPKTGLYKRMLTIDELFMLTTAKIVALAADPIPFDLSPIPKPNGAAYRDWLTAVASVQNQNAVTVERRATGSMRELLNRSTYEFMRDGATTGDRHRALFSAAANLAEFGCAFPLAWALLSEPALDSGLPPAIVRRQIECGLNHQA